MTKKVSLTLTEEMWGKIESCCADNQLSRSEVIRNALESYYSK
ncbi:ribbon-helix-helix domain-containing protein [Cohnella lubricantis]|nr:ribbon-helix-helix domain-containing protein [Cohnella lubricantis]